jgi:hypothetical protein
VPAEHAGAERECSKKIHGMANHCNPAVLEVRKTAVLKVLYA